MCADSAAVTNSSDSAAASHRPTVLFQFGKSGRGKPLPYGRIQPRHYFERRYLFCPKTFAVLNKNVTTRAVAIDRHVRYNIMYFYDTLTISFYLL